MVLWMLNWATMGACGLIMESVFTMIGMQWAPFFLNIWLIANASGAFASFELMAEFYKYGYAIPFYHCVSCYPTYPRRIVELMCQHRFRVQGRLFSVQRVT
jgi:hypothetical protein